MSKDGEFELNNSLNQRETLVVLDSRDHRGDRNNTTLVNGSLVREFVPDEKLRRPEEHRITISAKKRTLLGKKSGVYEGQIHFVAVTDA